MCDPSKAPGSIHRFIPTAYAALLPVHVQGTAALYITLTKVHEHFWDALVEPGCASALGNRLKFDLGRWYSSLGASALSQPIAGGPTCRRMMTPETWRMDWPDQSNCSVNQALSNKWWRVTR